MPEVDYQERVHKRWEKEYSEKGSLWRGVPKNEFKFEKNTRVLEIGCGNGKTLFSLYRQGCDTWGVDISKTAVEMCKKIALEKKQNPEQIVNADVRALPFENNFFDAILCIHVLEHLLGQERVKAVAEMQRVLKKGGRACVQVFSVNDFRYGKGKEVEPSTFLRGNKIIVHHFREDELETTFSGWKKTSLKAEAWQVRYSGKLLQREVLIAIFEK